MKWPRWLDIGPPGFGAPEMVCIVGLALVAVLWTLGVFEPPKGCS